MTFRITIFWKQVKHLQNDRLESRRTQLRALLADRRSSGSPVRQGRREFELFLKSVTFQGSATAKKAPATLKTTSWENGKAVNKTNW